MQKDLCTTIKSVKKLASQAGFRRVMHKKTIECICDDVIPAILQYASKHSTSNTKELEKQFGVKNVKAVTNKLLLFDDFIMNEYKKYSKKSEINPVFCELVLMDLLAYAKIIATNRQRISLHALDLQTALYSLKLNYCN